MEVKWLFEQDVFEDNTDKMIEVVKSKGMEAKVIPYIPFESKETLISKCYEIYGPDECVIFYGSLNFGKKLRNAWDPGVYLNEKAFECTSYYPYIKDLLLHYDSYIMMPYGDLMNKFLTIHRNIEGRHNIFIRPNSGTKEFTGFVTSRDTFEKDIELAGFYDVGPDLLTLVAPAYDLKKEWRFVIVEGKVISGSLYRNWDIGADNHNSLDFVRRNSKSVWEFCEDQNAWDLAQKCAEIYNPDKAWTIDICQTAEKGDEKYKVLEIGCFSCAGMYGNNLNDVIEAVSESAAREWKELNEFS